MRQDGLAKIQHYVPKFILKRFIERKEQVWVFDKQRNKSFKTNIKNVAAESGFYNFNFQGKAVTLEFSLSDFEGQASRLLKKIIKNESLNVISEPDRTLLSHFFALQFVRTPQWRHMWDGVQEGVIESLRKRGLKPENIENYDETNEEKTKFQHMKQISNHAQFSPHFYNKIWVLFKTPEKHPFWISDNPIAFQNSIDHGLYGNIGLAVKGIEIYLPISKTLCLGMFCKSHSEIFNAIEQKQTTIELQPEAIVNINSLQVIYSSRFVFSNNNDFSLLKEMLNVNPHLKTGPKMRVG